ncbi:MAG: UDP-N-acetylglucosamine 2-epimerase (non-hydrolyzing) [Rhodospirillaceae bacterium]
MSSQAVNRGSILVVMGTRPEAIKLAPVVIELRQHFGSELKVCSTGQHRTMLEEVLRNFEITADYDLNVMRPAQTLTDVTAAVLRGMHDLLAELQPRWVIVQGDTTTSMAAALAAFYQRIPVAHVEAGLRTGDMMNPWPEELNRRLTGVIAARHYPPTTRARDNLLHDGVDSAAVLVTGNTVIDALMYMVERLDRDAALCDSLDRRFAGLDGTRRMILVTGHRRESFGDGFRRICTALAQLSDRSDLEIVYPVHLNPNVQQPVREILGDRSRVHLIEPVDYATMVYLMRRSHLILTDSGGIQEEAPSLGKPVLIMRDTSERPEGIEAGVSRLVGTTVRGIVQATQSLLDDENAYSAMSRAVNPFGDGTAARKIAENLINEP